MAFRPSVYRISGSLLLAAAALFYAARQSQKHAVEPGSHEAAIDEETPQRGRLSSRTLAAVDRAQDRPEMAAPVNGKPDMQKGIAAREVVPRSQRARTTRAVAAPALIPGNYLPVKGGALVVHTLPPRAGSFDPRLSFSFSPQSQASLSKAEPAAAASSSDLSQGASRSSAEAAERPGLTYEQELFRTKWGWSAFDQAQRQRDQLEAEQ